MVGDLLIRIAKLAFHAKESPIRTRAEVLSLVSSRFNSPDVVQSPAVQIPPNPGHPQGVLDQRIQGVPTSGNPAREGGRRGVHNPAGYKVLHSGW